MEGMRLKVTPVIGRCLLHHPSVFGPMAGTCGLIASPNSPDEGFNPPPASTYLRLPTHPLNHPTPTPIMCLQ